MKDSLHSIFYSARSFFFGTALSRISGLMRDVSLAYFFGTSSQVAVFLVAFRLSHLARRLFGEGALQQAFVPLYASLKTEGSAQAVQFFRALTQALGTFLLLLIPLSVTILMGLGPWMGQEPLFFLTALMLPSLLFICLYGLNASLLQFEGSYFIPALSPVVFNLSWVLGAWICATRWPQAPMVGMAWCINIACVAQWALTLAFIPFRYQRVPWSCVVSESMQRFVGRLSLGICGVAAAQLNNALDPLFALSAHEEGPAWLWYAIRMQQLPMGMIAVAISSSLLPPLSRCVQSGHHTHFTQFLQRGLEQATIWMVPLTCFFVFCSESLTAVLFGYGTFRADAIAHTSHCLIGYALGLLPATYTLVYAASFYARDDYRTPARISVWTVFVNIVSNALFVFGFKLGVFSVALATSWASCVNCALLNLSTQTPLPKRLLLSTTFASLVSSLIAIEARGFVTSHMAKLLVHTACALCVFLPLAKSFGFLLLYFPQKTQK